MNISSILGIPFAAIGVVKGEDSHFREALIRDIGIYRKYLFDYTGITGAVLLGDIRDAGVIANIIGKREFYKDIEEGLKGRSGFYPWSRQFIPFPHLSLSREVYIL